MIEDIITKLVDTKITIFIAAFIKITVSVSTGLQSRRGQIKDEILMPCLAVHRDSYSKTSLVNLLRL